MNKFYVKCAIAALLVGISSSIYSQNAAINSSGNPGNPAAVLDLSDPSNSSLGMLLPNVDIPNVNSYHPVNAPPSGLIVWNTNSPTVTVGGLGAGFYYWTGVQWVYLYNTGIPLGNFIDNQPISKIVQHGANFHIDSNGVIGGALNVKGLSTLGAVTSVGTDSINASGSAMTTIGSGGTGMVLIGNNGSNISVGYTGINTASNSSPEATLDIYGSVGTQISATAVTGPVTLDATYNTVLADPSAATFTMTIPAAGPSNMRRWYTIIYAPSQQNVTDTVNIIAASGSILSGATANASIPLTIGSITLQSNGTSWYVVTDWGGQINPGKPWITTGNGGLVDGVNFIGTTNTVVAVPINFSINGNKAGRIDAINDNTYMGYLSGNTTGPKTTGTNNTGLGYNSVSSAKKSSNDVGVGSGTLQNDTTGNNVAAGYNALNANTIGSGNAGIGYGAMKAATASKYNFAGGYLAMGNASNTGSYNTAIGDSALYSNAAGTQNVGIGSQALYSNTSGTANVGIGYNPLRSNLTGISDVGIGYKPLYLNTSGSNNTAIGNTALYSNTTGSYSNAVGYYAGYSNSGPYNNSIGYYGGYGNSSGSYNNDIGYYAGYSVSSVSYNNAIGYYSQYGNTGNFNNSMGYEAMYNNNGGYNNAIGYLAGYYISGYSYNNYMGYYAGEYDEGGNYNNAMGMYSQYQNYGGYYNNSMGYYSMPGYEDNYGWYNNGIGYYSLAYNEGYYNNSMGMYAGYENYTGSYNNAIGDYSMYNGYGLGSSAYNNAMGYYSMYYSYSGSYNNAVGYYALFYGEAGSYNNAIGYQAMYGGTYITGGRNSAIGYQALYSITGGSSNVAVGDSALQSVTGSYNTAVGFGTTASTGAISNSTAIGNGAVIGGSNSIVLGNHSVTGYEFNGAFMPYYSAAYNAGTLGQALVSQGPGVAPQWGTSGAANNGLSFNAGVTQLGGTLIQNTSITASASNYTLDDDLGTGAVAENGQFTITNGGAANSYLTVTNQGLAGSPGHVGIGTGLPNASAALDVTSTTGGILFPRMSSAQITAIPSPANGLVVFNTTTNCLELFSGGWRNITCAACTPLAPPASISGPQLYCGAGTGTYTCTTVSGASAYVWSISPNVAGTQITSPTLTHTTTATFAATPTIYTITVADDSGVSHCQSGTISYTVQVAAPPAAPATPAGNLTPVVSSSQTYTVPVVAGNTYSWTSSNTNVAVVSNQSLGTATVTFGATAGTTNICVTATQNGCTSSPSCATVISNTCSGIISLDASNYSADGNNVFTITTTHANDLVVVSSAGCCAAFSGSVSVSGGGNPAATFYQSGYDGDFSAVAMYWFVAPTATTYTITVTSGYQAFTNFAIALTGFCSTPNASNFHAYTNATTYCNGCTTITGTIAALAGSYTFAGVANWWYNGEDVPTFSPLTSFNSGASYDGDDNYGWGGEAVAVAATQTITCTDPDEFGDGDMLIINIK